jgi:hypothetical protein
VRAIVAGHELDNILVLEIDLERRKRAKGNLGDWVQAVRQQFNFQVA